MIRIGINASGGDFGAEVVGPAAVEAAQENPSLEVVLYSCYPMNDIRVSNLTIITCRHADHELSQAFQDMAEGKLDTVITATASARLLVTIRHYLEDGIRRPGLIAPFPTRSEHKLSYVMDVGATAKVNDPVVFIGWAGLGYRFIKKQTGILAPTIGLLNIAAERACPEISAIDKELADLPLYLGYVEPKDFFDGKVDLLLTDGFGGNWILKWTERLCDFVFEGILQATASCLSEEAYQEIRKLQRGLISYDAHLVSPLLGIKGGIVFRVHGAATLKQIAKAFGVVSTRYKFD